MTLRFTTAGESHGPGLVAVLEGLPAGLELDARGRRPRSRPPPARARPRRPDEDRARPRRRDCGAAPRPYAGQPRGAPDPEPRLRQLGGADEPVAGRRRTSTRCTCRGPGTPIWPACRSSASHDVRNVLERASARETAARVACGALAKALLRELGVEVRSHVLQIGSVDAPVRRRPDRRGLRRAWTSRPCAASTPRPREAMVAEIDAARKANESLGGVYEVRRLRAGARPRLARLLGGAPRRPARSGDHVDPGDEGRGHRRRLRPRRARRAREAHDEIFWAEGRGFYRETNRAGGLEGGMTTGDPLVARGAMKPLPTLTKPLALGGHRHQGAGAGAARAHRLLHGPGGRGRGRGDGGAGAGVGLPREVRRRPHRRRARGARARTRSGSDGGG